MSKYLILKLRDPEVYLPRDPTTYTAFYEDGCQAFDQGPEPWRVTPKWKRVLGWAYVSDFKRQVKEWLNPADVFAARCSICGCDILECPHDLGGVGADGNPCTFEIVPREELKELAP